MLFIRSPLTRTLISAAFLSLRSVAALGLSLLLMSSVLLSVHAQEANIKPKPRIVARYSETGIVSTEGLEKLKVYQYKQANGVTVFTDKAPVNSQYQILLYDCFACRPDSIIDWNGIRLFTTNYDALISHAADTHQLEPALIRAVIHAESAFNARAISRSGAMGLMQLMPGTAKDMGVIF
jgi:soluble lytic murein transglycosylase-like protein